MDNNYYSNLLTFLKYLKEEKREKLQLGIGFSIDDIEDTKRSINFDIILSKYEFNSKIEEKAKKYKEKIIINYDFNQFCSLNKIIINKLDNIDKIEKIIFDSSTFKFLTNIKFLGILYYLILQTNGSIYIESNVSICEGELILTISEFNKYRHINKSIEELTFRYQSGIFITYNIKKYIIDNKIDINILSKEDIYKINIKFFEKWFYGSTVEILEKDYPIDNYKYPITKYYKITKKEEHKKIIKHIEENIDFYNLNLSKGTNINLLYHTMY
jgi:hypothetical protein